MEKWLLGSITIHAIVINPPGWHDSAIPMREVILIAACVATAGFIVASSAVVLEVLDGPAVGKKFTFRSHDTFRLGRSDSSNLRLDDDLVISRNHLQIEIDPPRCFVRDLQSANGTFVNGERIAERLLVSGVTISGGKTLIRVLIEEIDDDPLSDVSETPDLQFSFGKTDLMTIPPAAVAGYELAEEIGSGTMGAVYRAVHSVTGNVVAVKLIAPSVSSDDVIVNSMLREAAGLCELNHKRIVRFIGSGVEKQHIFLIMEYVAAVDLMPVLRDLKTATRIRVACGLIRQVLDGLDHAHNLGVILSLGPVPIQQYVPDISSELVRILNRALAPDPAARFRNAAEMRAALQPHSGM